MSDIFEQVIDDESENIENLEDNSNYEKNSGSYVFPKNLVKLKLEYSNEGLYAMLPDDEAEASGGQEALLEKYSNEGIYQIEDTQILKLDPFIRMGKPAAIVKLFGGKDGYMQAVKELEDEIYKEIS